MYLDTESSLRHGPKISHFCLDQDQDLYKLEYWTRMLSREARDLGLETTTLSRPL